MRCSARQDRLKNAVSTRGQVRVCKLSESIDLKKGIGGQGKCPAPCPIS